MIPKIIHQIWVGDKKIPKHIKEWMNMVKDRHPDFTYYFWHDGNLPIMPKKLQTVYDSIKHPSQKSDLLRYYLCFRYGGLYLDADFKVKNVFSNTIFDGESEAIMTYNDTDVIEDMSCAFIGCKKGSPIFRYLLDNINQPDQWLGPNWYTQIVIKYFGRNWYDIDRTILLTLFSEHKVYSMRWIELNNNFYEHIALASWYPNSEWNIKFTSNEYE